jgi:hypothetical protein
MTTTTASRVRLMDVLDHVEHFRARVVQDALAEATAGYWRRRAVTFEWVIHGGPIPAAGDTTLTPRLLKPAAGWTDRDHHAAAAAQACRHHADLALLDREPSSEVWAALHNNDTDDDSSHDGGDSVGCGVV